MHQCTCTENNTVICGDNKMTIKMPNKSRDQLDESHLHRLPNKAFYGEIRPMDGLYYIVCGHNKPNIRESLLIDAIFLSVCYKVLSNLIW